MFEESLKFGEYGEHTAWNVLNDEPWVRNVVDVRKDKNFQEKDIDFLVENLSHQFAGVEVKTDFMAQKTGNLVYEKTTSGNIGCFEKTQAKYIFYLVPKAKQAHWISVSALRDYIHNAGLTEIEMGDNATGYLIPIEKLKQSGVILKTHEGVM